jgi:hypothetical protein
MQCAKNSDRDEKLIILQEIAKKKGGKCLATTYTGIHTKLSWQCAQGHKWQAEPNQIKNRGSWCPHCAHLVKHTIEKMRQLAKDRNGKCLSSNYENNKVKLQWQCIHGHTWMSRADLVIRGAWCPYCSHSVKRTIEEMHELAKSRGGRCLSLNYVNSKTPLKWQCKDGHKWKAAPANVLNGQWCAACYYRRSGNTLRAGIDEFISIANKRGGKLLSKKYINSAVHLAWQCGKGHRWNAVPNSIKQGRWCPYCAGKRKLEMMDKFTMS